MPLSSLPNKLLRPLGLELRRLPPDEPSRKPRFKYFQQLVDLVEDVPGDFVECGVGAGKSLFMLSVLNDEGSHKHPRRIWGFDSFEGLPDPAPVDTAVGRPKVVRPGKYAYDEREVRERILSYGLSRKKLDEIVFVKGFFPNSFPEYSGGPIALLHLDVDLYQSYKDCLEWFEPLVSPGGVVAFDEYLNPRWSGATQAVEEYYGGPPPGIQESRFKHRRFLVKG